MMGRQRGTCSRMAVSARRLRDPWNLGMCFSMWRSCPSCLGFVRYLIFAAVKYDHRKPVKVDVCVCTSVCVLDER